ncbi:hypothetical protein HA466_0131000 [Hirschfeldia incana]|nr:hypothetical protein HA466_0131000 [Hirschfeldia incana]
MDEIWERAVETALAGETEPVVLTLDGAVKCVKGQLPRPEILEKYPNLEHLSIAGVGVSSLDRFPRLGKLQKLVLSDNRISGGLKFLVRAGLGSLRDLDLSNNRIGLFEDLVPLAELRLVSLDLYKCPVTKVKDYRARVFGLVKSLKYLDKMDAEENEILDSEDDDDEEEEEEEDGEEKPDVIRNGHSEGVVEVDEEESEADEEEGDDDEERPKVMSNGRSEGVVDVDEDESEADDEGDDPEIDGEERPIVMSNGHSEGVVEVDEDESEADDEGDDPEPNLMTNGHSEEVFDVDEDESEADEEETATRRESNGVSDHANGFRDEHLNMNQEEDDDSGEEDEYEPDGLLVDDENEIDEEVSEGEEEVDLLPQRDIHGEVDGHEEVAEVSDSVANGAQNVLMDIGEEGNDDSGEEDEYETDGLIVDDTHGIEEEDVSEGVEEVDLGVPHGNELLRNILPGGIEHGQDEDDDDDSWEEEEDDDDVDDGEEEEYGTRGLGQSMAEAIQVDEEDSDDEGQVVYSIAPSNLKRKRDEDGDGDSVSTSPHNSDDDNSSDDASSDDEDE